MTRIALAICCAASPALADGLTCTWQTECYGSYGCEETGYETYLEEAGGAFTWSTEAGGAPAWDITPPGEDAAPVRLFLVPPAGSNASAILLTLGDDGEAAFTQHGYLEGITSVTYFGRCESR